MKRRSLLSRAAAVLPALALPAVVIAAPVVDPHPAWLEEYFALREWCNGDEAPENLDDDLPQWARSCDLEDMIAETPAVTLAGVLAQVRLAQDHDEGSVGDGNMVAAIDSAVKALEKLTGAAS